MAEKYIPSPIDTRFITLPHSLDPLIEIMARNVHEVWAKQRMDQGWKYGPRRDDEKKEHPCLVPYEELPEIEKDYDRATSQETLKLIIESGYRIISEEDSKALLSINSQLVKELKALIDVDTVYDNLKKEIPELLKKYYGSSKLCDASGNTLKELPGWLNLELPSRILKEYEEKIGEEVNTLKFLPAIKDELNRVSSKLSEVEMELLISLLKEELIKTARHYEGVSRTSSHSPNLEKKHEDAKRITMRERFMQDNDKDIREFAEALLLYTRDILGLALVDHIAKIYRETADSL